MPAMAHERTAQRAARAVYGSIIALAVIVVLDEAGAEADEVLAATFGSVVAAMLAEGFAEYLAQVIRGSRHPTRSENATMAADIAAGTLAALVPLVPFLLVQIDVVELPTAYDIALWLGVGVIGAWTLLANRLAGMGAKQTVVFTVVGVLIGLSLIAIKAVTH
jgi:hypothetical protein